MKIASARIAHAPWWTRLLKRVFGPRHAFVSCAACGNLLGRVTENGASQPWRRGERDRTECFGRANIAGPGEPPLVVCITLRHIRFWA